MIIVTGPGRSGTSVLSKIYDKLGFEVPGPWNYDQNVNAGYEIPEVARLNYKMLTELGGVHSMPEPAFINWEGQQKVADRYGREMRTVAERFKVVKDPRFCITTRLWIMAGVEIDFVAITTRELDVMRTSRMKMGLPKKNRIWNEFAYEVGLAVSVCIDYEVSFSILRFPNFIQDYASLYSSLRFPRHVTEEEFKIAFDKSVRKDMVHHGN